MDEWYIRTNYSTRLQWHSILEPHLLNYKMVFDDILFISEIIPFKEYIAFLKIQSLEKSPALRGKWFTDWIKMKVYFREDIQLIIEPVHLRKDMLQWKVGTVLVDNRDRI